MRSASLFVLISAKIIEFECSEDKHRCSKKGNYIKRPIILLPLAVILFAVIWSVSIGVKESAVVYSVDSLWEIPPNFTPSNIEICVLPPEEPEPIGGGLNDDEVVVEEGQYQGKPVLLVATTTPSELPDWFILPPVICPHYTQRYHAGHRAVDLINRNCNGNNWIVAIDKGVVTFTGWRSGYGNRIEILHENGMVSTYSHLSAIDVEVGQKVNLGLKIGTMGTTGKSTGIHLHFEIIYKGVKIDPDIYLVK